jgi:hypothetical protein
LELHYALTFLSGEFGLVASLCGAEILFGGLFLCIVSGLECGDAFSIVGVEKRIFQGVMFGLCGVGGFVVAESGVDGGEEGLGFALFFQFSKFYAEFECFLRV